MHSACAVLYCHLWPAWLYNIFPHYLINGTIKTKALLKINCVFQFSLQLLSEKKMFPSKKNWKEYCHKHAYVFMQSNRSSCQISMKLESSRRIFKKKSSKYQISWKSSQWEPSCSMHMVGQTDRHDWANSRFSQSCECAEKLQNT